MISGYGQLAEEAFEIKDLTWKVPNIFKLKDFTHNYVSSPLFRFGNYKFFQTCIDVSIASLYKERDIESDPCIEFFLLSSDGKIHRISMEEHLEGRKEVVCTLIMKKTLMEKKERTCPEGVLTICCRLKMKKWDTIKGKNLSKKFHF